MNKPIKIYLAHPYSKGDQARNVHDSYRYADYIATQGFHVKNPLASHFWHMMFEHPYDFWIRYDLIELEECNALVRVAGESSGADNEVIRAEELTMPVHIIKCFSIPELNKLDSFLSELKKLNVTHAKI